MPPCRRQMRTFTPRAPLHKIRADYTHVGPYRGGQLREAQLITARRPAYLPDQRGPDAIAVIGAELVHLRGLSPQLVPALAGPNPRLSSQKLWVDLLEG